MVKNKNELEEFKAKMLLEEARRKFDKSYAAFDKIRDRCFALLTIELGVLAFFLANYEALIPEELYGKVILLGSFIGIIVSICTVMYLWKSLYRWPTPIDSSIIEKVQNAKNEGASMAIIAKDYFDADEHANNDVMYKMANLFNFSMITFSICAVLILIVEFLHG